MLSRRFILSSGSLLYLGISLVCHRGLAMKSVKLLSGHDMPIIGLGTWKAQAEEMEMIVNSALDNGYRHIDTAFNYNNEESIGNSLKSWFQKGGKREELFITTKLPNYGNRPKDVEKFLNLSLKNLGLDYVDMYLVHMPFSFVQDEKQFAPATHENGSFLMDLESSPVSVWKEMEKQVANGKAKSIGLSNFNENQIQEIWDNAKIKPSNLQVECHALMQQKSLREYCKKKDIIMTAYSPLGSPASQMHFKTKYNYTLDNFPDLLNNSIVTSIASKHDKTSAQILLRHSIQHGNVIIPKSSSPERIKQNIDIFDFKLSDEEMKQLDDIDEGPRGRIFNFLFFKGVENHPYYPFKDEL